jgi:hypothetical protein
MLTPPPYVLLQRDRYRLRVRASDRGEPPSSADVDVELDVVDRNNKPPIWDLNMYGPIHIRENVTVGTVVTTVKARFVPPLQVSGQEKKSKRVKRARGERAIVVGAKIGANEGDRSNFLVVFALGRSLPVPQPEFRCGF